MIHLDTILIFLLLYNCQKENFIFDNLISLSMGLYEKYLTLYGLGQFRKSGLRFSHRNYPRLISGLYGYILYLVFLNLYLYRSYLFLGKEKDELRGGTNTGTLLVTDRSIVIEWRDEWDQRMRRFRRRSRKCK